MMLLAPLPGLKVVSREPSELSRAIRFLGVPLYSVNQPSIRILPSGWRAIAIIASLAPLPGLKVVSKEPSELSRAI